MGTNDEGVYSDSGTRGRKRVLIRIVVIVALFCLLYELGTAIDVWKQGRQDQARAADAIVVLGAAQFDGTPSAVLRSRLDHAYDLWDEGLAPIIVVTGGKIPGDSTTEASAGADYLIARGVPDAQILREVQGRSTFEELSAVRLILTERSLRSAILVSDRFHAARTRDIASDLGLDAFTSPAPKSPIGGSARVFYYGRETFAVSVGRIVGYDRIERLQLRVRGWL